jgi:dihydrofolate synthase/folylpolyglutamate synthase
MTYQQTLDYIFHKLPMFSRTGAAAYKADLRNTIKLCAHLGNLQDTFKSIHVGGTNGKGSVSHMLASVLQANGYKTGLYTSPHLYDFRERIKINGAVVEESFVIDFIRELKPVIEEIEPSFFEITVAMAFHYFALQKIDVAVIEVGLGGRLDSTNIITPQLSVITNIGWDHTNLLGNSLQKIATEKAGIIKHHVPIVIGERQDELDTVFREVATVQDAPLAFASDRYTSSNHWWSETTFHVSVQDLVERRDETYDLDLGGIYQTKNICTVLQALEVLGSEYRFDTRLTKKALGNVKRLTGLQGRWETVGRAPRVVLDAAHNEPGVQELTRQLDEVQFARLHIIMGVVKEKELGPLLSLLPKYATYYYSQAQIPRALAASALAEEAQKAGLNGHVYKDVNEALGAAQKHAALDDLILVCGSIFLLAEVDRSKIKNPVFPAS